MGRAILPARLKTEFNEVKKYLLNQPNQINPIHKEWAEQLRQKYSWSESNSDKQLQLAVGEVFAQVLADAGVFKRDEVGIAAFKRFCHQL